MHSTPSRPTSYSSSRSDSAKKHKSGSSPPDKHRDRDRNKDSAPEGTHSLKSRTSELSSASGQHAIDILKALSGNSARRSMCRPEFLEELAKGVALAALDKNIADRLKIIAGVEGIAFFRRFLGENTSTGTPEGERKGDVGKDMLKKGSSTPVVFAVSVIDAGRKVVDYYMTWRGKTRAKHLKGSDRRNNLLDDEFRRVARTLDREYKRVSLLSSNDDIDAPRSRKSGRAESTRSSTRRSSPPPRTRSSPPNIIVSPPEPVNDAPSAISGRLSSANDSVISLPFLNMIRNVPLGNRVPLRVTNPDTISILSPDVHEEPAQVPNNISLETLVEAPESAENSPGDPERQASVDTLVQASDADQRLGPPKRERSHKGDSASVSSSGSRSSRSSKSSRSSRHRSRSRSRSRKDSSGSSSRRKNREPSSGGKSDKKEHSHRHPSSSGRKDHDGEDDSSSRRQKHHGSSGYHDEKKGKDDDRSSRKSDRSSSGSHKSRSSDISSDFLIVLLDTDKVDKDPSSWHGLGRSVSTRSVTKTSPARITPWSGPLVRPSDGVNHNHSSFHPSALIYHPNDESSSDDEWKDSPVIPLKSYVEAMNMGYVASDTSTFQPRAVIPPLPPVGVPIPVSSYAPSAASINSYTSGVSTVHGGYTPSGIPGITISLAPSVTSSVHTTMNGNGNGSPYLYSSPRPVGSPYVPAWISPQSPSSIQLPLTMTPSRPASGGSVYPGGYVQSVGSTPRF